MSITKDNFFIKSTGYFKEIKEVPNDYEFIFKSKSSAYYVNKDKTKLVRVSDHWGVELKSVLGFY